MVDKSSSVPLYQQIQDILATAIRAGEYQPGDQVPSELEIAARFDVSRMTARKALDQLVQKGILYRQKGKGTYVAEQMMPYGLSTMISFSQTLQSRGFTVSTEVLEQATHPMTPDIMHWLKLQPNRAMIVIRRLRLVKGKPAAIHTSYLDYQMFSEILELDLHTNSLHEAIQRIAGEPISYTKDSVQADLATEADAALLGVPEKSPVLKVEGVAYTAQDLPIRFTRAIYRGDSFELVVTNRTEQVDKVVVSNVYTDEKRNGKQPS